MPLLDLANDYYDLPPGKLANVATFLEMREKPTRTLVPLAKNMSLRKFASHDLDGFRDLFKAVGQDLMWFSRVIMPDAELAAILAHPKIKTWCFELNGKAVGLLELNFEHDTECELAFFGLVPSAIGGGLGRMLMDEALRQAWAQPISRLWVHTCTFDAPQALPFYVRSGFSPFARKVEFHDDPRLQGKLPMSASPHIPILP